MRSVARLALLGVFGILSCEDEEPAQAANDAGIAAALDATISKDAESISDAGVIEDAAIEADAGVPASGVWEARASLARGARQETAVVAFEDELYVIGGYDGNAQIVATVEAYDPANDVWRDVADLPMPMHHVNAGVVNGRLFVLGALGNLFGALRIAFEYEKSSNSWIARTPLPEGRQRGASAVVPLNGMLWVIGGLRGGSVAEVDSYDPENDSWSPEVPLPRVSDHLVAGAIDGKIYVAGGRGAGITAHTDRLDIYDPASGWTEGPAMPTSRGGSAAAVYDGRLFVFGGEGNQDEASGVFAETEALDPALTAWTVLAPMRTPRHGTGAAVHGDRIYVPGGADVQAFSAVDTVEVFVPPPR